jgi:hypothetical protein
MKNVNFVLFLAFGLIMVLFVSCFSPITVMDPAGPEEIDLEGQGDKPFTVSVYVGRSRSVTGVSTVQIKSGLYNFVQLVVLDQNGALVALEEVRKNKSDETSAELQVDTVTQRQNYHFLLLFGYWERIFANESTDNEGVTTFAYNENAKPVLLAAGYQSQEIDGGGMVTVTMWPLVIDAAFVTPAEEVAGEPAIAQTSEVIQFGNWKARWTINRNDSGSGNYNGLTSLLLAQSRSQTPPPALSIAAKRLVVNGVEASSESAGTTTNIVEFPLPVKDEMTDIGTGYTVNFNLEYVPFGLAGADWSGYDGKSAFNLASSPPTWIIRNGLNDEAQNAATDFNKAGKPGSGYNYKNFNGNGGAAVQVKENLGFIDADNDFFPDNVTQKTSDGFPDGTSSVAADLIIYTGTFLGPGSSLNPKIYFRLAGFTGYADVYYCITPRGEYTAANPLPYNMFTQVLGSYTKGNKNNVPITLPSTAYQNIWLTFRTADGRVSNRIALDTSKIGTIFEVPW